MQLGGVQSLNDVMMIQQQSSCMRRSGGFALAADCGMHRHLLPGACCLAAHTNNLSLIRAVQVLAKRKGFVRIALQTGAQLVRDSIQFCT